MTIPQEVKLILGELKKHGYEAYVVGGCVRDLLMGKTPDDWDVTTNARPEEIQKIFSRRSLGEVETPTDSVGADYDSFYENSFGTVGVKTGSGDETLRIIEVTTYRIESGYSDKRHPDKIEFADKLDDDLKRRDFTINALAMDENGEIVDLFGGQEDLKNKVVRAVGEPSDRFNEDALRMMRAVRLAAVLGFEIESKTSEAIKKQSQSLREIAQERIRDELVKIINSPRGLQGIELLRDTELLEFIIPELLEGYGVGQNKHHIYSVWEHNLRALQYTADKNYSFEVRMASLLHDVGKPRSKRGDGVDSTFYAHEIIGGRMTAKIMERLRFSKDIAEKVTHLVRFHLFYYNVGEVSAAGVRRFLSRVGPENVDDLLKVREADRIGSGVPKAVPYKLRHLLFMIEKVKHDPISPKMLKVKGEDVMRIAEIQPSPKVGQIIAVLLEEVLEDPTRNRMENLELRIKELAILSEEELRKMAVKARGTQEEFESGVEEEMKKKFYVK